MTGKETVKRAIEMKGPERVPLFFFNKDMEKSDILFLGIASPRDFKAAKPNLTEWGFEVERLDKTMGQAKNYPIVSWDAFKDYVAPDPDAPGRYEHYQAIINDNADKYLIGVLGISGFNRVTFLRGFENTLEDLYVDRDNIEELIDVVMKFENGAIKNFARYKLDGVAFYDDWGTQSNLMVSPAIWREIFKPRYKAQFDLVHSMGMKVYFHCCGQIYDIIGDLIEIGADILNLNQPDLFGIERMGRDFGGRVCFNCPVDHQTVAINGNRKEIFDYVERLNRNLGCHNGGFIGYIEEYSSVGMSDENYRNIVEAFEALNKK